MFEVWNICPCATLDYLLIHTISKFPSMVLVGHLHWGYPLIYGIYRSCNDYIHMTFLGNTFCYSTFYLKCQRPKKLENGSSNVINSLTGQCAIYRPE